MADWYTANGGQIDKNGERWIYIQRQSVLKKDFPKVVAMIVDALNTYRGNGTMTVALTGVTRTGVRKRVCRQGESR